MARLYFLGGTNIKKGLVKKVYKKVLAEWNSVVLVFPWTAWFTTKRKNKYREIIKNYFKSIGAKKVIFAELSDSLKKIKRKIKSSDLVYLPGGEPRLLVERIKKRRIDSLLRKHAKTIVVDSAGALVLCEKYAIIKGQGGRPKTTLEPGLELVNFTISVHYGSQIESIGGISSDKEHKSLSKKVKIYAIPEHCALVYDIKNLKSIGKIYIFDNGKKMVLKNLKENFKK